MAKQFKVWVKLSVTLNPCPTEHRPREFWVSAEMIAPPVVGLRLKKIYGVPFISIPPITVVYYNCETKRYSCHTEPFVFRSSDEYQFSVDQLEECFDNGPPPE